MTEKINPKEGQNSFTNYEVLDTAFYKRVSNIIYESRKHIASVINTDLLYANWEIGRMIVEKQKSLKRAEYGERLISELSARMCKEFGKGFDESNLRKIRQFYMVFQNRDTLCLELTWSHYRLLMRVKNEDARSFYINESLKNHWSVRQLAREIHNISYERYILGNKNYAIIQETADKARKEELEEGEETRLFVKEPLLLGFVGFKPGYEYYETDLEQAIIDHLGEFLLELGQGYTFVARQKRIDIGGDNFYIDLVLYNIFERCYVIIDLKTGKLTHRDIGQMQMYVNYYNENFMIEGDKPPVGLILCAEKNDKVIKYTLGPTNKQIRAYKYITDLNEGDLIKAEAEKYLKKLNKD